MIDGCHLVFMRWDERCSLDLMHHGLRLRVVILVH